MMLLLGSVATLLLISVVAAGRRKAWGRGGEGPLA
jgi:hypothetical protein